MTIFNRLIGKKKKCLNTKKNKKQNIQNNILRLKLQTTRNQFWPNPFFGYTVWQIVDRFRRIVNVIGKSVIYTIPVEIGTLKK